MDSNSFNTKLHEPAKIKHHDITSQRSTTQLAPEENNFHKTLCFYFNSSVTTTSYPFQAELDNIKELYLEQIYVRDNSEDDSIAKIVWFLQLDLGHRSGDLFDLHVPQHLQGNSLFNAIPFIGGESIGHPILIKTWANAEGRLGNGMKSRILNTTGVPTGLEGYFILRAKIHRYQ
jgi:hypothetical protein